MSAGCHHHHHHGQGTEKALNVTLFFNVLLLGLVGGAAFFTRSSALFAETVHRAFDAANPLILWAGNRRSKRPKDEQHPMGHTREAFIVSLAAAMLMLAAGAGVSAYHGINSLLTGHEPMMTWWGAAVAVFALVCEGISLWYSHRAMGGKGVRSTKNTVALALVFENSVDMLGMLLALAGYGMFLLTGQAVWDAVFSLAIAGLLAYSSIFLMSRNISLLTGESADEKTLEDIRETVLGTPFVMRISGLTVSMTGPEHMCCRLSVVLDSPKMADAYMSDGRADGTGREAVYWTMIRTVLVRNDIKERLLEKYPKMQFIHVECG